MTLLDDRVLVVKQGNQENDQTAVEQEVTVRFLNSHVVRLRVPVAALGPDFSATQPWIGWSVG